MNTPLHPLLVHFPIALALLLPLLAGGMLLALVRNWLPKRAWALVSLGQLALLGSGLVAMRSGEADEDPVEKVVAKSAIETHEEAAKAFVIGSGGVLVLALLPLVVRNRRIAHWAAAATVAGSLVVLGLGYRVGKRGGELVYQHGAASAFTKAGESAVPGGKQTRVDADDR